MSAVWTEGLSSGPSLGQDPGGLRARIVGSLWRFLETEFQNTRPLSIATLLSTGTISMAWFLKSYRHGKCGTSWTDAWSCACNDRCPQCDAEVEPYDWDDLSVVVEKSLYGNGWVVSVSPLEADRTPEYVRSHFAQKEEADNFAARESQLLERQRQNMNLL
jgi:hypothetical protein